MTIPRQDHKTARAVDTGCLLADEFGAIHAAMYMRKAGVPLMVALRVILKPKTRRT